MPELQRVEDELADQGLVLVTVVTGGHLEHIKRVVETRRLKAPVLLATGKLLGAWQVNAVPWTVLVDRQGKAVQALRGGYEADAFRALARSAL